MQILLVEDDESLAKGLRQALRRAGFSVNVIDNGQGALLACRTEAPDILILDLGLQDLDGLEVLRHLRQDQGELPVLILTARGGLDDKVRGLDAGADDYLAKPFEFDELLARLRVIERRLGNASNHSIELGGVSLDTATMSVTLDGTDLALSRREYMLLKLLMEQAGRVQTREKLESRMYGWGEEVSSNALEVHIHHLRKKLGESFIRTVRGVGYLVDKP